MADRPILTVKDEGTPLRTMMGPLARAIAQHNAYRDSVRTAQKKAKAEKKAKTKAQIKRATPAVKKAKSPSGIFSAIKALAGKIDRFADPARKELGVK
jgi:hypothetical protein